MRTTINLPDGLVEAAKAKAAREGRTFTSVLEDGLRRVLTDEPDDTTRVELPTFGDPAGRSLVDPLDREALWAVLDADGVR